jgi:hypothetical protein
MPSTKYELPDQGDTLVRLANEAAGDRGAQLVAAEVNRVRRPDGALVASELSSVKMDKHSPLHLLGTLLGLEAIAVGVWTEFGFGMFQKRSMARQAEKLCREKGLEAAVDWALASPSKYPLKVVSLRDSLEGLLNGGNLDSGFFRSELARSLRKWR